MSLSAAGDYAGIYNLYKDIALGQGEFRNKPIYYLGNLLSRVQIRVSLTDGNNRPPNDSSCWKDFFDRSRDASFYTQQILSVADMQLQAEYERHLAEYHLSGLSGDPVEFYERYLKRDLSNTKKTQIFNSHAWYQPDMTGLDYAVATGIRNCSRNQYQWFRLWKSGLLEHGGIVDVTRGDCGTNDSGRGLYTVNLKWPFRGKYAPAYNFPSAAIGGFYTHISRIYTGRGNPVGYAQEIDALGPDKRYTVDISPIAESASNPYPNVKAEDRFTRYAGKEVTKMNNGSFTFAYVNGIKMYSYYVKGFTVNISGAY